MSIPRRRLGAGGPEVGAIGLGCMSMSWAYADDAAADGDIDGRGAVATIHRALDLGVTHLDTADVYGPHTNESLVGRALRSAQRAADAVVATKVGLIPSPAGFYPLRNDARPERIRAEVDGSLARLGLEVIDLYYLHRIDPAVPLEESWGAMADLAAEGKVRRLGLSEASVAECERAAAIHPVAAVQSELSLWTRGALADVVPWCRDHGAAFVPFSPLGRGYLTGVITEAVTRGDDFRASLPRFTDEAVARNRVIVDGIAAVAARHGATPAQVALAWVLAQGPHVIPIPGTRRVTRLEENAGAAGLALSADDLADLDALPEPFGARY